MYRNNRRVQLTKTKNTIVKNYMSRTEESVQAKRIEDDKTPHKVCIHLNEGLYYHHFPLPN